MISHYRIIRKLGEGGMGEVYLAEDTRLDRKVAIKSLPTKLLADEGARRRLTTEARTAAKLDHPNICTVHGQVEAGNQTYIVMQYVEGETLSSIIEKRTLTLEESLDIALQVADALAAAHAQGIIHRDIKPQNIIITPHGKVKVLDFGLATIVQLGSAANEGETPASSAEFDALVGTPPYMSPEQAMRVPLDQRSDLFSLGALLYECLTSRAPFFGSNKSEMRSKVIHTDPPPPSQFNRSIPSELDWITLKALAKRPEARYQSAIGLMADLRRMRQMLPPEEAVSRQIPKTTVDRASALLSTLDSQSPRGSFLLAVLEKLGSLWRALLRLPLVSSTGSQLKSFYFGKKREE
jgi:serine/threonine-protein kinase